MHLWGRGWAENNSLYSTLTISNCKASLKIISPFPNIDPIPDAHYKHVILLTGLSASVQSIPLQSILHILSKWNSYNTTVIVSYL